MVVFDILQWSYNPGNKRASHFINISLKFGLNFAIFKQIAHKYLILSFYGGSFQGLHHCLISFCIYQMFEFSERNKIYLYIQLD